MAYGWRPDSTYGTNPLYLSVPGADAAARRYAYYHNDHLGTPLRLTDKAGKLIWSAEYDNFGRAVIQGPADATLAIASNLRYPGQYFDAETGLHYNYHRYYDPEIGRYVTRDPIGFDGGANLYGYAYANPIRYADPSGLFSAADLPTLPQGVVDGMGGAGDGMLAVVTVGLWNGPAVRSRLGIMSVDNCSPEYAYGKIGGEVAAALILMRARAPAPAMQEVNAGAKGVGAFADEAKLIGHFNKHGAEFGTKSASEYLQVGQDIMKYGQKVEYLYKGETRTGFVQFMGNRANGQSKFGFVGTNADGAITTIHTESGNSFWKMLNNGNIDKVIKTVP